MRDNWIQKAKQLIGQKFGRLTVIGLAKPIKNRGFYQCKSMNKNMANPGPIGQLLNLGNLFQAATSLEERKQALETKLECTRITATSGGGLVTAEVNGKQDIKSVKIDPSMLTPEHGELLEDLIVGALTEAIHDARQALCVHMNELMFDTRQDMANIIENGDETHKS